MDILLNLNYSGLNNQPMSTNVVEIERDGHIIATLARARAVTLAKGDIVRVRTGGGGGYGDPRRRSAAAMQRDLALGYVTAGSRSAEGT